MLWKVVEVIVDTSLKSSAWHHYIINVFSSGRVTRMATLELKLVQELVSVDHDPLFLVLMYLKKAYDTVDQGRLLNILEVYDAGPYM